MPRSLKEETWSRSSRSDWRVVCVRRRSRYCSLFLRSFTRSSIRPPFWGRCTTPPARLCPGATVTLKNAATGITATAVSDGEGNYQFLNVRIGTYSVRAELQGFSVAEAENVGVTVN